METQESVYGECTPSPIHILSRIKAMFCKVIRSGTASDIRRFYFWFKKYLESPIYPVLKDPFDSHVAQSVEDDPIMALAYVKNVEVLDYVLSAQPNFKVTFGTCNALNYAINYCNKEAVAMFLYHGFEATDNSVHQAALAPSTEMKQIFDDFGNLPREEFAAKYKLKIEHKYSTDITNNTNLPKMAQYNHSDLVLDVQREILNHVSIETAFAAQFVCKAWRDYAPHKRALQNFKYLHKVKFGRFHATAHYTVFDFVVKYDLIYDSKTMAVTSEEFIQAFYSLGSRYQRPYLTRADFDDLTKFVFNEHPNATAFKLEPANPPEDRWEAVRAIYVEISPYFGLGFVF